MMKILPINNSINYSRPQLSKTSFNRSSLLSDVVEFGKTISKNPKIYGFAAAGAVLAGSVVYLATKLFGAKSTSEKNKTEAVTNLLKENSARLEIAESLKKYPELKKRYYELITNSAYNPNDIVAKNLLGVFELLLEQNKNKNNINKQEEFLQSLETNYSDDIENLCVDFYSHLKNSGSTKFMLRFLRKNKITSEDLQEWTKYPSFNLEEYLYSKNVPQKAVDLMHDEKIKGNIKSFKIYKATDDTKCFYTLLFPEGKSLKEKFQTIVNIHGAIYGPITLKKDNRQQKEFTKFDIETELYDRLKKDKILDSVYNLVKFLNPKILEKYNLTSEEVKALPENSKRYRKLREDLGRGLVTINYDSPRMQQLLKVINDTNMPKEILSNGHATMRFISRFVLKNNFQSNLAKDTMEKLQIFQQDLEQRFKNNVRIGTYTHQKGKAPSFYLGETSLGDYVKITLNKEGEIHTLYESILKPSDNAELK